MTSKAPRWINHLTLMWLHSSWTSLMHSLRRFLRLLWWWKNHHKPRGKALTSLSPSRIRVASRCLLRDRTNETISQSHRPLTYILWLLILFLWIFCACECVCPRVSMCSWCFFLVYFHFFLLIFVLSWFVIIYLCTYYNYY